MDKDNERPATVPKEAVWNASQNEWELGEKNEQGQYIGEWKWWLAPNGYLCCHTFFDDHGNILSFKRFHPNGEISRYGTYENGQQIEDVYLKSSEPTTEVFVYGNTDDKVFKAVKRPGVPVSFDYFDKDGNHLNPTIEKKSLVDDHVTIATEEEIAPIKEAIYKQGRSHQKKEFGQEFYLEVILPKIREQDQRMFDHIAGDTVTNQRDFVYVEGDLHLSNLHCLAQMKIGVLVINGNLTVDKTLYLTDDLMELLVVTGNVTAKNVLISGFLFVYKDLTVKNCLLGDYNHGSAVIEGNLTAKFFHPEEYFFEANGNINFTYAFGNPWRLNQNANPEAFNWNERKLSEFIVLLHENIHEAASFEENPSLLDTECREEYLFEYIDGYELITYLLLDKPFFKE